MNKIFEFIVKLLHIKGGRKRIPSIPMYKSKEEEYESWLGV